MEDFFLWGNQKWANNRLKIHTKCIENVWISFPYSAFHCWKWRRVVRTKVFQLFDKPLCCSIKKITIMILWIIITSFSYVAFNIYMFSQKELTVINYMSIKKTLIFQANWITIFQKDTPSLIIYIDGGMLMSTSVQLNSFHGDWHLKLLYTMNHLVK